MLQSNSIVLEWETQAMSGGDLLSRITIKYDNSSLILCRIWLLLKGKRQQHYTKGHFTHEPRAVIVRLWEPKRKCPKAVPRHIHNHVVWSRTLECSVWSYVTGPSTKCYFGEILFIWVSHTWYNRMNQRLWAFGVLWSPGFVSGLLSRGGFRKTVQVTMKHDPFDAM